MPVNEPFKRTSTAGREEYFKYFLKLKIATYFTYFAHFLVKFLANTLNWSIWQMPVNKLFMRTSTAGREEYFKYFLKLKIA